MPDLACYLLRSGEGRVADFDDAIDSEWLPRLRHVAPRVVGGVEAKLYIAPSRPHKPGWAPIIIAGFGDVDIPNVSGSAAVVIARRERPEGTHFLAFTFGYAWQLLKPGSYQRGFGLRTALNVVYEGDTGEDELDPARLRSVDAKRVGPNILRSRHQVSGVAVLEELQVDVRRDVISSITGIPRNMASWGRRVTGRDPLHFSHESFGDLGRICDQVIEAGSSTDYAVRFSFIDDYVAVNEPVTEARLLEELVATIQSGDASGIDLAPPVVVDWERVAGFRYHTERGRRPTTRIEMRLRDYIETLRSKNLLDGLTPDLLDRYGIWAVDGDGSEIERWTVRRCLYGEIRLDNDTYVLDDGDFYVVSDDYLSDLDDAVRAIPEFNRDLPPWRGLDHEDVYNRQTANGSPNYLLLDKRLVRPQLHTDPIEVCDILTRDAAMIHVKRYRDGSASLSHLFAQGLVSADLTVTSRDFRAQALAKIEAAESERANATGDSSFLGRFRVFDPERVTARDYEVVFAVRAVWGDEGFTALPFFSKITLRSIVEDLARLGFRVSVARISAAN